MLSAAALALAVAGVVLIPGSAERLGLNLTSKTDETSTSSKANPDAGSEAGAGSGQGSTSATAKTAKNAEAAKAAASPAAVKKTTSAKKTVVATAATGTCGRKASTTAKVRVTSVKLTNAVTGYGGEGDTEKLPLAIAATPSGTSWVAWLGTNSKVYLAKLDCADHIVGKPTSFTGIDLQDVQADATGGVLLLTRAGSCHTGPLCGGASSPCNTMVMVRFNTSGQLVWQRQVTNLTSARGGYDDGARFVWWYQHHGRLASDGTNYAAYFGTAITVQNGSCVDVHEGDRMQVVGAKGALLSGHNSFAVGCSHAWTSRVVWDPRAKKFVMVCATDSGCRIAQPNPYRTVAAGKCDGTLFGGDLVLAKTTGYWTAWSQAGTARLSHFTSGAANKTINTAVQTAHPHLVSYGSARMLLAWQVGSTMKARAYNSSTGAAVGGAVSIAVKDHDYQAFKAYPDGSAAYPAVAGSSTIKIARVMPLSS